MACFWLEAGTCLAVPALPPGPPVLRVYFTLDSSGSMLHREGGVPRITHAASAAEHWVKALEIPSAITVEVLSATDHVDVIGTFPLRSEVDRAALIDAIRHIQPVRNSRTSFAAIDAGLAEIVRRDTTPSEDFSVSLLTDGLTDEPATDLRADEIGERTTDIGGGVFAVTVGTIPMKNALVRRGAPMTTAAAAMRAHGTHASVTRALHRSLIQLKGDSTIAGTLPARLFGGWNPLRLVIHIENPAGVGRLVRFDSVTPAGISAVVRPNPLAVPAGGSGTVTVELSAPEAVQGQITVIGHLPDGRAAAHSAYVQLMPGSWVAGNLWPVALSVVSTAVMLLVLARWLRRAIRIGDHAHTDRQAALAIGDSVALDVFSPGVTGTLHRGWLGYRIAADGQPVFVSGRSVQPGRRGRYRLGEEVRIGNQSFAVYPIDAAIPASDPDDFMFEFSGNGRAGGLR